MTNFNNPTITHRHQIPTAVGPVYTSDPSYELPLLAKIIVKSIDLNDTYYTFDPFNPSTNNYITYADVQLSISHHGTFRIEFQNEDLGLDTTNIDVKNRVWIFLGKTPQTMTKVLSGFIRESGYSDRSCSSGAMYYIAGAGTGIRFNERVMDVFKTAKKVEDDGHTIDETDDNFFADQLVDDLVDDAAFYPEDVTSNNVEGTGGLEYIISSDTQKDSPIEDFLPSLHNRYNEMGASTNLIEEYTGGRACVDVNDKLQLQPLLLPYSANTGFIITNVQNTSNDLADETMYITGGYSSKKSIFKDTGYGSKLYGILTADPSHDIDKYNNASTFYANKDVEIAQRFRVPTNPNFRLWAAVEAVDPDADNSVSRSRWRICEDAGGLPRNSNGIIDNKYVYNDSSHDHDSDYNLNQGGVQLIMIYENDAQELDTNKWYWLILSSVNASGTTGYWRWYHDNSSTGGYSATASTGTSSATDGGSGWTLKKSGPLMLFETQRFKAEPFELTDQKAIDTQILIDNIIPNFPSQITTKLGATKYLIALSQFTCRPRRNFSFNSLTVPNKLVLPGDVAYIVDSKVGLGNTGTDVVCGQITDVNYTMGTQSSDQSASGKGLSELSLEVVEYSQHYN